MNDPIERRAMIDALIEYFRRIGKLKRRGLNQGEKAIALDVIGIATTLPSAQDEEIMECRYCNNNPGRKPRGCPMAGNPDRKEDDYCSYWERRTYATD